MILFNDLIMINILIERIQSIARCALGGVAEHQLVIAVIAAVSGYGGKRHGWLAADDDGQERTTMGDDERRWGRGRRRGRRGDWAQFNDK